MTTKLKNKPASRPINRNRNKGVDLPATGAASISKKDAEDIKDANDVAVVEAKLAQQAQANTLAIVDILEGKEYVISQSLTQSFGKVAIAYFNGDVDSMPRYRFTRRYLGNEVILVDLFRRQSDYDRADVEIRRKLVHELGGRYAAAGPGHSRLPHKEKSLREKYPSISEQLEAR